MVKLMKMLVLEKCTIFCRVAISFGLIINKPNKYSKVDIGSRIDSAFIHVS